MAEPTLWEYRGVTLGQNPFSGLKDEEVEACLNELGAEGWEVIRAEVPGNSMRWKVVAKRPLTEASRRQLSWPG
jgi:Domain of unknown function (DUF4177)